MSRSEPERNDALEVRASRMTTMGTVRKSITHYNYVDITARVLMFHPCPTPPVWLRLTSVCYGALVLLVRIRLGLEFSGVR